VEAFITSLSKFSST
jgi:hypothetical protein